MQGRSRKYLDLEQRVAADDNLGRISPAGRRARLAACCASKCAAKYARCKYESPPPPLGLRGCKVLPKVARYTTCAIATCAWPAKVYGQLQKGRSSLKKGAMGEILSHSLAAGAAFPFPLIFIASTSAGDLVIPGLDQRQRF